MTEVDASVWPAPAKINLFLHVMGRRQDGYHEIQTLFQLLDWGDRIRIRRTNRPGIRLKQYSYCVPESEDIVFKAARLLQPVSASGLGADIEVEKQIPPGSGMGGGSSDAATVLMVLNQLWNCGLSGTELERLGASLGADVPVFVRGNSAMAGGFGEKIESVSLGRRHYVLVFPDFPISTGEIFTDPGLVRNSRPISREEALALSGRNDCEAVVRKRFPEFERTFASLRKWGRPMMTGTGSGIFIPMRDKKSAMSAAREMKSLYNVRAVSGVDQSPLHTNLESDGQ